MPKMPYTEGWNAAWDLELESVRRSHKLKTESRFFKAIEDGRKTFEIRLDDRQFREGDLLELLEWDCIEGVLTGGVLWRRVTYITSWGQKKGYVVMAIAEVK